MVENKGNTRPARPKEQNVAIPTISGHERDTRGRGCEICVGKGWVGDGGGEGVEREDAVRCAKVNCTTRKGEGERGGSVFW
jgi:hypothetical protein